MVQTAVRIGPLDHGRRMSLADFEHAERQEGYLYELGRGVVVVSDVPGPRHFAQVDVIREQLYRYKTANPGVIHRIGAGSDCRVLLDQYDSERHADVAVYKTRPPARDVWRTWVPELLIEVVSPGSEDRDYVEKREEYLAFGVREYWVIDAEKRELLVLRRVRNTWTERVVKPPRVYRTRLLPGLEFDLAAVFAEADEAG